MTIRVVLGEDNVLVREGVRALLESFDDIQVVGVAADAPALLRAAAETVPDVVVTDIKMPPNFRLEGIDCAHEIRARHPGTGVVVLSAHDDEDYAIALLGKGQSGLAYLLKDRIAQGDELVRAIREVAAGRSAVDPAIAERLSGRRDTAEEDRRVLDLMARGMGYAEMAGELGTTQEAVDRRVTELFRRMAGGTGSGLIDEFKRLHAAVVEQAASRRTLASFVPQQLADRLATQPGAAIEPQEVEVTVLFSDIRGFSTLAEQLPARDVAAVVGRHLQAMAEVVLAHGGTIDKFQGDAVMAVFGAPDPQPDHAERALRCALAMQARQEELNAEGWGVPGLPRLRVGIGVNTGLVIAGTVGGGGRLEYTVVGDAVNVASRLQAEAGGGEIVAAASTVAAAPGIPTEPVGSRHVKGRGEPVEVFRVRIPGAPRLP
ncbi:MAG TPA: adenylate/guanylate cyclase domain-containing protein [Actinomycetota bacterium]|nr:adenylate/guanylate cyclase domain-containing protein [Actinomycetota bacterium]